MCLALPQPHRCPPLPRPPEWVPGWGIAPLDPRVKPHYLSLRRAGRSVRLLAPPAPAFGSQALREPPRSGPPGFPAAPRSAIHRGGGGGGGGCTHGGGPAPTQRRLEKGGKMAPSRDRLLHFGFKATVSERGRELGGQDDVGASSGRRASDSTRAGDCKLKARPGSAWVGACRGVFGAAGRVPVRLLPSRLALCSPVRERARAHPPRPRPRPRLLPGPRPPPPRTPPPRTHTHTRALPCLASSGWARARPPRAPAARGLTVRGCAPWGRGGLARPPRRSAPPLPRRSEARAALPNEERRCWQVGSVFVLG